MTGLRGTFILLCKRSRVSLMVSKRVQRPSSPAQHVSKSRSVNSVRPTSSMDVPIFAGLSVTIAPAFSSAATLSEAAPCQSDFRTRPCLGRLCDLPLPPEMMAPAWPIRRPGGAVRPAMKPTTGLGFLRVLLNFSRYSAASSSIDPPISPMMTMPDHMNTTLCKEEGRSTFCCIVLEEDFDDIDMLRPREWITTNANAQRLPKSHASCLSNSLVRQSTRPRHDSCNELLPLAMLWHAKDVPIFPGLWMCPG